MRRSVLAVVLGVASCAASGTRDLPSAPGGSASDFDRGLSSTAADYDTGSPAGAPDTIGAVDVGPPHRTPVARFRFGPAPAPRYAGPVLPSSATDGETLRSLQRVLAERGYYHGPVSGVFDPALADALLRFQADHGLPTTGRLDGATAEALGLPIPSAIPPRQG